MTDKEAQENELLVLESIYHDKRDYASEEGSDPGGYFKANLELPKPFYVKVRKESGQDEKVYLHEVEFLPPIQLNFQLPEHYPSTCPPQFTLTCQWLNKPQLSALCRRLDELWLMNENCEILFTWTTFLKNDGTDFLQITSPLELNQVKEHRRSKTKQLHDEIDLKDDASDRRAIQNIACEDLLATILKHDQIQRHRQFEATLFQCDICFNEKLGSSCTQFKDCGHVYCNDCTGVYLQVQIQDGNVTKLTCPYLKCETQASPAQVKQLVPTDLFCKYDQLLLQNSLDQMSDICYCPRPDCRCPVIKETGDDYMGHCPQCYFVFCTVCSAGYHGKAPCRLKVGDLKALREKYLDSSPEQQKFLERKYGRRAIKQAIEETYSEEWLEEYTKQCPECKTHIQKVNGCNKMTCIKCHCYFCWLCGLTLSRTKPYSHFNNKSLYCFGQLFQGLRGFDNDEESDEEFDFL